MNCVNAMQVAMDTDICSAKNMGVVLDDQLDIKEHVTAKSQSCRFLLYNIRRIRPYLTCIHHASTRANHGTAQSRSLQLPFASLPACAIQQLQLIPDSSLIFPNSRMSIPS